MLMYILWTEGVCILLLFSLSLSHFFFFLSFSPVRVMSVDIERKKRRNSVVIQILACPIT